MPKELDKIIEQQHKNVRAMGGKSYAERAPYETKLGPLQDQLNDFLAQHGVGDLLEFMKRYSVDPTGGGHRTPQTSVPATKTRADGTTEHYSKLVGGQLDLDVSQASVSNPAITFGEFSAATKKIAYAYLEKVRDAASKYVLRAETVHRAHAFPIYYLPWESQKVLRMTIPAKGTAPAGVPDPDIFFTAGINGCSIFFEGNATSPTIYHAGTEQKLGGINSGAYWRNLYKEWSATGATDPKGAKSYGEVKKSQYISAVEKTGNPLHDGQTDRSLEFKDWLANNQKDIDVTVVQPWGCVFGLRDAAGTWEFYLQKNATVSFYTFKKSGLFGTGKRTRGATEQKYSAPIELTKCYPGRAHVRLTEFTKVGAGI